MHPHTIQTIHLKHLRCHLSYTTLCVNMTTNVAQVSVYDLVTSGCDFLAQYKPITKATCISSLVCLFSHVDSRLACAGYLCKVIKSIRVWLRPVRCSTDDKSGSVNRLKLGGGGPDSSPIRLYIHPMSFPITLQLLFARVLTLIRTERRMTFTEIKDHARMLLYKQTNILFSPIKHENANQTQTNSTKCLIF